MLGLKLNHVSKRGHRRQANILTNYGLFYCRIYASIGRNSSTDVNRRNRYRNVSKCHAFHLIILNKVSCMVVQACLYMYAYIVLYIVVCHAFNVFDGLFYCNAYCHMIMINRNYCMYRQTSNLSRTLIGNKIVDHSDVVGTSPTAAAPTTSSFPT